METPDTNGYYAYTLQPVLGPGAIIPVTNIEWRRMRQQRVMGLSTGNGFAVTATEPYRTRGNYLNPYPTPTLTTKEAYMQFNPWSNRRETMEARELKPEVQVTSVLKPQPPSKSVLVKEVHLAPENTDELTALSRQAEELLGYSGLKRHVDAKRLDQVLAKLDIAPFSRESVREYKIKMMEAKQAESPEMSVWWDGFDLSNFDGAIPQNVIDMAVKIKKEIPEARFQVEVLSCRKPDPFLVVYIGTEESRRWIAVWDEPTFDIVDAQLKG